MFEKAKWIWYEKAGAENSFGEFIGEFASQGTTKVKISCDGDYTLFINGRVASSNQYGDFEHYKSVDEIDITELTLKERNQIAILVWHFGKSTQRYKKYTPGVICEVSADGKVSFFTDEATLCRKSQAYESGFKRQISSQLGFSFSYDATKEDFWTQGQPNSFKKAVLVNKKCAFVPRPNKRLSLGSAVKATHLGNGVYDLGKEYVGLLTFELEASEKTKINIAFGECLDNGQVKRILGDRDFSVDYTAKAGKNRFTHYMLRLACRYFQLSSEKPIKVNFLGLIPQFYPVEAKEVCLSNPVDNEIYKICLSTLQLCMMEHYVDCPWREQCLYAFDSRNQMLSGYYAFENKNREYARSNLILMSKDKRDDGLMSICYPCGTNLTIPSFSLYYILSLKEYLDNTNDLSVISEVNAKVEEIIKAFLNNMENGIVCKFPLDCHWNFYDWSPHADGSLYAGEGKSPDPLISVLTVLALKSYREICEMCGLPYEYKDEENQLKNRIKDLFFDTGSGLFHANGNFLELINALAVKAGIPTHKEAEAIAQALAGGALIPCSLSMKCFTYDALIFADKDKYKNYILEDIRRTYTPMLTVGTVWETAEGASAFGNAGSLCHGWSSTPIYYYSILQ